MATEAGTSVETNVLRFGLIASGIQHPDLLSMFEAAGKKAYPLADATWG